jgi:hypothetical protein
MQRKIIQILFIAFVAGIIAGCVPSWNALFTEKDLIFDAKLVGTFNGDDGEVWEFAKDGDKRYKLTYTDKNGKASFEAHLLKLQDRQFLNVHLDESGYEGLKLDALTKITMFPTHLFFRVDEIGTSLKMAAPNPDWLGKHLEKDPKAIAHLRKKDGILLLTAETKELQAFVLKHATGEAFFGDPFTVKRKSGT